MAEFDRLNSGSNWIDVEFVERERTPREIIEVGIQFHITGMLLSNTKQFLERLGVERSRTAIHNWVQKTDVQPSSDADTNHIAVNETVIQINDERHWLYAAVERIFREVKRRTPSFSNTFSTAKPTTAESWLESFAVWWNQC